MEQAEAQKAKIKEIVSSFKLNLGLFFNKFDFFLKVGGDTLSDVGMTPLEYCT
jgi:hypothetical protein